MATSRVFLALGCVQWSLETHLRSNDRFRFVALWLLSSIFYGRSRTFSYPQGNHVTNCTEILSQWIKPPNLEKTSTHLFTFRAITAQKFSAEFCVICQFLVQVKTLTRLLTETLKKVFTHWHLVEVCVVWQQTFFILTRAFDELWTDYHIALIVKFFATTVCICQAFSNATVDWANYVWLLEFVAGENGDASCLGSAVKGVERIKNLWKSY